MGDTFLLSLFLKNYTQVSNLHALSLSNTLDATPKNSRAAKFSWGF